MKLTEQDMRELDAMMSEAIGMCVSLGCTRSRIKQCWALKNLKPNPGKGKTMDHHIPEDLARSCLRQDTIVGT